jgi:hypothetical protein
MSLDEARAHTSRPERSHRWQQNATFWPTKTRRLESRGCARAGRRRGASFERIGSSSTSKEFGRRNTPTLVLSYHEN